MEKTITNLRKECKKVGIKVKKQTFSHGPHVSFEIGGYSASSVIPSTVYAENEAAFNALKEIKEKFNGMTIDGDHVYGLK